MHICSRGSRVPFVFESMKQNDKFTRKIHKNNYFFKAAVHTQSLHNYFQHQLKYDGKKRFTNATMEIKL